jgi:hypothetical protein
MQESLTVKFKELWIERRRNRLVVWIVLQKQGVAVSDQTSPSAVLH